MSWYVIVAIFLVGVYGVVSIPHMVKKVVALSIANSAITVLFVYLAAQSGDSAPIISPDGGTPVDPVPHALMLTAIVVGVCVVALALVLVYRLYQRVGSLDMREVERAVWHRTEEE